MNYELHPEFDKILSKLAKKDKVQFEAVLKKIDEIIQAKDTNHYKNLRAPLQMYKRVHVHSSFVLLFKHRDSTSLYWTGGSQGANHSWVESRVCSRTTVPLMPLVLCRSTHRWFLTVENKVILFRDYDHHDNIYKST